MLACLWCVLTREPLAVAGSPYWCEYLISQSSAVATCHALMSACMEEAGSGVASKAVGQLASHPPPHRERVENSSVGRVARQVRRLSRVRLRRGGWVGGGPGPSPLNELRTSRS